MSVPLVKVDAMYSDALLHTTGSPTRWCAFVDALYVLLRTATNVDPSHRQMVWQNADFVRLHHCGTHGLYIPAQMKQDLIGQPQRPLSRSRCITAKEMESWDWIPSNP